MVSITPKAGYREPYATAIALPRCADSPCGTCPYRRDVASGVWDASEYAKLKRYDGPTMTQSPGVFLCHQENGHLCAGWVACHDAQHLLAFRLREVDPMVFDYVSPVPVFSSGAEAAAHGLSEISAPGIKARRSIEGLRKKRSRRSSSALLDGAVVDAPQATGGDA